MLDPRVSKMAEVMVYYSAKVKKGNTVLIMADLAAEPLVNELYKHCLIAGAFPSVIWNSTDILEIHFKHSDEEQQKYIPEYLVDAISQVDAVFQVVADRNTRAFTNIDPKKIQARTLGASKANSILMERMGKGELNLCITVFPTEASAQEAGMSLSEYEEFVFGACGVDKDDPVGKWTKVMENQEVLCNILNTKKKLRIVSKDTDISMCIEGRKWDNCCGNVNFPDGEIFTGPIEDSVEGTVRFSFPGTFMGKEIEDIKLRFEKGKVVEASASKGEDLLLQLLDNDEGSRFVGEIGIGTNYGITKFTKHMLFDEKIGGTIHIAVGRGIPETGSKNVSSIHWDMLCDMRDGGEIYADDELIYKNGRFLIK